MLAPAVRRFPARRWPEWRFVVTLLGLHVHVELAQPLRVPTESIDCHRAVDEDRQDRDATLLFEAFQPVEELLDTTHREGRNNHPATAADSLLDDPLEDRTVVIGVVQAIAIRGLDQQVIRFRDHRRIRKHRAVEPAEITAKEQRLGRPPGYARTTIRADVRR